MIVVKELSKIFGARGRAVRAVDNVTFSLPEGAFAAIIGKSGSGKSTLLSLLGGLDKPTSGSIEVAGRVISKLHDRALTKYRCKSIGFVFQQFYLIPNLTALENVMLPMEFAGLSHGKRKLRAVALLNQVGISGAKQKRKPGKLSGGEQQRVAIARALANRPNLILADEPTGNLDSETGVRILELLQDLSRTENTTVVTVTHDMGIAQRSDYLIKIADGKLVDQPLLRVGL